MVVNLDEQNSVVFMSEKLVLTMIDGKNVTPFLRRHLLKLIAALKQLNLIHDIVKRDVT